MALLKNFLRIALSLGLFGTASIATAESTVYVFTPSVPANAPLCLTINGEDCGNFDTGIMKHHESNEDMVAKIHKTNPELQIPIIPAWDETYPAVKKCVLKTEGPTLFLISTNSPNIVTGQMQEMTLETTVDIEDGKIYYLNVNIQNAGADGQPDVQLMAISDKDGKKKLKDQKIKSVSDYVEQ